MSKVYITLFDRFDHKSLVRKMQEMNAEDYFGLFQIDRSIGTSHFSRVYLATQVSTGRQVALKVLIKFDQEALTTDKSTMISTALESPHIVQVFDIFEDIHMIVIVMEYVPGGELFDWIATKGTISEAGVAVLASHLLLGLKTLHDNNIVHRNIKPENILISETDIGATIKLTDYCLAQTIDQNGQLGELSSTEICSSPEVLRGQGYGKPADIWSLGVIIYILLCGRRPFEEDEKYPLFIKASSGEYTMDTPEWDIITEQGKDFVARMLQVDPNRRMTVDEALDHPWLKSDLPEVAFEASLKHLQLTTMGRKLKKVMGAAKTAVSFRQFTRLAQRPE